jgi:hypothetical protein
MFIFCGFAHLVDFGVHLLPTQIHWYRHKPISAKLIMLQTGCIWTEITFSFTSIIISPYGKERSE